ncbi:MAG: chemotaxis protein CheW [Gammaproteobacteria bacterium]|nr:chemotaxis protein CheW [Gammaproteobacteria bacterium]MBL7000435.1 chemotaxis protein CheW [Gammaproteobacteria bacterium]
MAEQKSLRCIQLPLVNLQLLLPNAVVAEIISYTRPEQAGDGWYDGLLAWRGVLVPVVSVEGMCAREQKAPGVRSRIAIVYNLSNDDRMPYVGFILQDIPRAYLAEEDRMQTVTVATDCEFLLGRADMMLEQLMIPDLDAIMAAVKDRIDH